MYVVCAFWKLTRSFCAVLLSLLIATLGNAQQLIYPPASPTAAAAFAGFDERAKAVIAFNACSREAEYASIWAEFAAGKFGAQGEPMTSILMAKAAYVRGMAGSCVGKLDLAAGTSVTDCVQVYGNPQPNSTLRDVVITPQCMVRQINEAVMAMKKTKVLGSSDLPCIESLSEKSNGEFDVDVPELVRLLYIAGPAGRLPSLLAPATIDHMYAALLATQGPPSDESYSIITGCEEPAGDQLGSPEDAADRHAWYNEVADAIGDAFE